MNKNNCRYLTSFTSQNPHPRPMRQGHYHSVCNAIGLMAFVYYSVNFYWVPTLLNRDASDELDTVLPLKAQQGFGT